LARSGFLRLPPGTIKGSATIRCNRRSKATVQIELVSTGRRTGPRRPPPVPPPQHDFLSSRQSRTFPNDDLRRAPPRRGRPGLGSTGMNPAESDDQGKGRHPEQVFSFDPWEPPKRPPVGPRRLVPCRVVSTVGPPPNPWGNKPRPRLQKPPRREINRKGLPGSTGPSARLPRPLACPRPAKNVEDHQPWTSRPTQGPCIKEAHGGSNVLEPPRSWLGPRTQSAAGRAAGSFPTSERDGSFAVENRWPTWAGRRFLSWRAAEMVFRTNIFTTLLGSFFSVGSAACRRAPRSRGHVRLLPPGVWAGGPQHPS